MLFRAATRRTTREEAPYFAPMEHAPSSRAPQTGPPPSPDWSLYKTSSSDPESGFATYGVLDAVGVRLGTVSGWVRSPGGEVTGLCVDLRGFALSTSYLIPLGYATGVDPRHRTIHLREITRRNLTRLATPCDGTLPPREVLESVFREAPAPRAEIVSVFRQPERGPLFSRDTPLVVPVKRGDGHRHPATPAPPAHPAWQALKQGELPTWKPLHALGTDAEPDAEPGAPRWL